MWYIIITIICDRNYNWKYFSKFLWFCCSNSDWNLTIKRKNIKGNMILMSNWERGANDIKMRVEDGPPCWLMDIILRGVSPKKGTLYLMEFWYVGRTVSSRFRPRSSHATHSTFSSMDPHKDWTLFFHFFFPRVHSNWHILHFLFLGCEKIMKPRKQRRNGHLVLCLWNLHQDISYPTLLSIHLEIFLISSETGTWVLSLSFLWSTMEVEGFDIYLPQTDLCLLPNMLISSSQ